MVAGRTESVTLLFLFFLTVKRQQQQRQHQTPVTTDNYAALGNRVSRKVKKRERKGCKPGSRQRKNHRACFEQRTLRVYKTGSSSLPALSLARSSASCAAQAAAKDPSVPRRLAPFDDVAEMRHGQVPCPRLPAMPAGKRGCANEGNEQRKEREHGDKACKGRYPREDPNPPKNLPPPQQQLHQRPDDQQHAQQRGKGRAPQLPARHDGRLTLAPPLSPPPPWQKGVCAGLGQTKRGDKRGGKVRKARGRVAPVKHFSCLFSVLHFLGGGEGGDLVFVFLILIVWSDIKPYGVGTVDGGVDGGRDNEVREGKGEGGGRWEDES